MKFRKDANLFWGGMLRAMFTFLYCAIVAFILFFDPAGLEAEVTPIFAIVFILVLLVLSVSVCGYLIFFGPAKLFLKKNFKEGGILLSSTLIWLFLFVLIYFVALLITAPEF